MELDMSTDFPTIENPTVILQSQNENNAIGMHCNQIVNGQMCLNIAHYWYGSDQGVQHRCRACYIREIDAHGLPIQRYMENTQRVYRVGDHYEMPPKPSAKHYPVWTLVRITPPDPERSDEQVTLRFQSDVMRRDGSGLIESSIGSRDIEAYGMRPTDRFPADPPASNAPTTTS